MPRSPPKVRSRGHLPATKRCTLFVVEGVNDVEFLRRISRILHRSDRSLPDLAQLERKGLLVMLPFGGGNVAAWVNRLAPLGCPELHLYDRESGRKPLPPRGCRAS